MYGVVEESLPLGDRLPRYGGGGAKRQRGSGGPKGRRERALPFPETFVLARSSLPHPLRREPTPRGGPKI